MLLTERSFSFVIHTIFTVLIGAAHGEYHTAPIKQPIHTRSAPLFDIYTIIITSLCRDRVQDPFPQENSDLCLIRVVVASPELWLSIS